jgi:ribose transport system substrate-binding protein
MKKLGSARSWRFFLAILVFVMAWGFVSSASAKDLIAASIANQINQAWINMAKGVKAECAKLGYDLLLIDAQDNTAKQISDTEDALTKNPKFLLLTGVDKGTAQLIDMAKKKGIPTITLMRDYGGDVVSFVGVDNVLVGEGIIDWYGKYIKGKQSKVIIITGTPGAASSTDRETGVNKTLPKYPNIKEVARQSGYYRREKTLPVVEDLLQRHADVEAVLGFNDEIAMGALAAAKAQGRKLAISGTDGNEDALKAIATGDITMSVVFDMVDMGRKGVQFADMVLKGKSVPKKYNLEMIFVTKENVEKYKDINK